MISHAPASLIEPKPSRTPDAGPPPRFSVIIPAFNYGRFLGAAVDSALAQQGPTFEVIVVDDGSTDETPQVMARYADRIVAMRQPNAGPFAACRAAFEAARGDWITVFDADDRLAPGALEALARAIDASPGCGVAVGPWRSVDAQGRERDDPFVPPRGERLADFDAFIRGRMRFVTGAAAIRRTALSVFYGFRRLLPRGMETIVFAHLLLRERFAVADRPLLLVHDHPGRLRERQHEHGITTADSVDVMFDSSMIDAEAARRRPLFEAWLLRERARLLYRQRRPREALAAFARAVRRDPRSLLDLRNARRALVSAAACLAVADPPPEPGRRDVALRLPHPRRQRADFLADPLGFIRRAGSLAAAVICSAPTPTCVLFHPDDARHVLVTQARRYAKTGFIDTWRRYLRRSIIS
ncbi:MAG: glycosyltransferase, partial [Phycisphaerae bacterium]|nr:glycosyltransferase [Phycisphaerae bacterium]